MAKQGTPELFPILDQNVPTGIARLAREASHADDGHLVEFRNLRVRSILNRTVSKRMTWMAWSINPYRGCEFACRYCYARYTHEFMAPAPDAMRQAQAAPSEPDFPGSAEPNFRDPLTFERLIFLKQNAAWLLEQELRRFPLHEQIALGTATDPWQPIERRARVTRSLLEVFTRHPGGLHLGIVTKSRLVIRDLDLLHEISRRHHLVVNITITTPDARLARLLEPRAPRPDLRFDTVARLREWGIITGVLCAPLLPGITDSEKHIDRMAQLAARANASYFAANPLFLKPCSRPTYLSFVREHYPALMPEYERRFAHADFAAKPYAQHLARLVGKARQRHGLNQRWREAVDSTPDYADNIEAEFDFTQSQISDPRPLAPEPSTRRASSTPRKQPTRQLATEQRRLFA